MSSVARYILIVLIIVSMPMTASGQALSTISGSGSDDQIVFIHTGQGSGTLDGVPFGVDAPVDFVIAAIGDVTDRTDLGNGWDIDHRAASITIVGVGTAFFVTGTQTVVDHASQQIRFSRSDGDALFEGPQDPAFQTWDMTTAVGPATGSGSLLQWDTPEVVTRRGILTFDGSSGPAHFNAVLSDRVFLHEGQGSGNLDGAPFGVDAPAGFVIAGIGDLANRTNFGSGWDIRHTAASITIAGVGTIHFISATQTFVNNATSWVGFSRTSGGDLFNGPQRPIFTTWDLTKAMGPIPGGGPLLQWDGPEVVTSGGVLVFDNSFGTVTFTMLSKALFLDGFESGSTSAWSTTVP